MLFIISGPTGSGKDTIIEALLNTFENAYKVPSTVTRKKRDGEVGYTYISKEDFFKKVENNEFLEYVNVHGEDFYGTLKKDIKGAETNNKIAIKILDVVGYKKVVDLGVKCVGIFIKIEDLKELEKRIIQRGESPDAAKKRLERVGFELQYAKYYNYVLSGASLQENINSCIEIIKKEMGL